ncbi:MAG: Magnesium and cobalt efflux protein CorC [Candidatus Anoxychlamydiales bacterium]|nr:Magnesium and cobalt efflux protein CorC [Candidatus Anoxychlamydiales bacterium]
MQDHLFLIYTVIFLIFFIIGGSTLTAFNSSLLSLGKFEAKENLKTSLFLFKNFFLNKKWEKFYILISITKHILYLLYAITFFLLLTLFFPKIEDPNNRIYIIVIIFFVVFLYLLVDFLMRFISKRFSRKTILYFSSICSIYLTIFLPLTSIAFLFSKYIFKEDIKTLRRSFLSKDKVLEMIKASELSLALTNADQSMIASFITFKEKVAREIMIPRVDIFAIEDTTLLKDALKIISEENYSRIPIYHESIDNITKVLMYKDLLEVFANNDFEKLLNEKVDKFAKPILYAPENKKISKLFQEFKSKKIHLAIIVNEYGSTEGVVTIEDILEELVGEIRDEYDIYEDKQYWHLPSGSLVVDAKMSIIDIEEQLKISIPHNPEYETIGGYIFHVAGTIPSKGWKIEQDNFTIEILISNDRCIEKIRITPRKQILEKE